MLAQEPCAEFCQEFAFGAHTKGSTAVNIESMSIKKDLQILRIIPAIMPYQGIEWSPGMSMEGNRQEERSTVGQ